MKKHTLLGSLAALITAIFLFTAPAIAQEDDEGPQTQGDDAKYLSITYVKFKAGHRGKAMQIISEHFKPASKKAGTTPPMLEVHFQTGEWDAAFLSNMEGGMADLEWSLSPDDVKWFKALAELEGGVDKAEAIWASYLDTVAQSQTEVGHYHAPKAE